MGAIIYLLQVSACMGLFYGFYYLMLSRLTFFTINRWYLVATLVLSFVIPLLTITVRPDSAPIIKEAVYVNQLQTFQTPKPIISAPQIIEPVINWLDVLKAVYLLAVAGLFVKLIVMLISFFTNIQSKKSTKIGNVHILHGDKKLNNGSFLNYIFLNDDELSQEEIRQIIEHEMLHVKLLHSVDRILVKIAQIVLWFNPFVYLYARAIEENHEFEVDREIGLSNDKSKYADMLLHLSVARQGMLYNSFSMVPLKKRIAMLFTKPTNHMKKVIYLLALPVVMLSCLAFARLKSEKPVEKYSVIGGVELSDNIIKVLIDGKNYDNDVLYTISESCIKSASVKPLDSRRVVNGKWVDVTVNINTKNGEVIYMTAMERENLVKERHSRSTTGFYSRMRFTDNDGKPFDKAIVNTLTGSASVTVKPEGKIGFVVNGIFYNENDIRFIDPKKSQAIIVNGDVAVGNVKRGEYAKGFTSVFTIKATPLIYKKTNVEMVKSTTGRNALNSNKPDTNKALFATITKNNKVVGVVKFPPAANVSTTPSSGKSTGNADTNKYINYKLTKNGVAGDLKKMPINATFVKGKTDYETQENTRSTTAAEKQIISRALADPAAPFFSRFHFQREGGNGLDVIAFKLGNGGGTANLDAGGKAAAFIDGKFYNEDDLKKVSPEKAATLGFDNAPDRSKREKIPGDDNYAMPFSFKSAKTDTLIKK
jgi:hypothetical protein